MKIQDLKSPRGSRKHKKRKGRGVGSGRGKTAGRGNKGQMSRTGGAKQTPGSEGGQMPLIRRIPKVGFASKNNIETDIVNLEKLNIFKEETEVTPLLLKEKGLIKSDKNRIKILGKGTLKKKIKISAHGFSASAKAAIEKLGGSAQIIKYAGSIS